MPGKENKIAFLARNSLISRGVLPADKLTTMNVPKLAPE